MDIRFRIVFPLCVLLLAPAMPMLAAEHHGVVRFGGLPVPGASITATREGQSVGTITDSKGAYSFSGLPDGRWVVRVEMLCFRPLEREVTAGAEPGGAEWDLELLPFEEIAAKANISRTPRTFQRTEIEAAPATAPSEKIKSPPAVASSDRPPDPTESADAFAINGSVNNGAATPFGMSGAFGNFRKPPNGIYHGALGLVEDNSALDGRQFSLTGQDTPKPAYNHLQASGSIGGPVRIPHLLRGDKTTFYLGYQISRNRNATTQAARMPTLGERNGEIPGSPIPASRISPQAIALLGLYPLPNFDNNPRYNYQLPLLQTTNQDTLQSRLSRTISGRDQVYGTFSWQRGSTRSVNLFGFADTGRNAGWNAVTNWQHRFNSRLFGHLSYQFSRLSSGTTPYFASRENIEGEAGITGTNQEAANWGPPQLAFANGIAGLSDSLATLTRNQTHSVGYDGFLNRGRHNIDFGGYYRRLQFNALQQQDPRGTFTFTGEMTGNAFGDFLLGIPATSSIAYGNPDKYLRENSYGACFTDDWRTLPSLTVNAGIRWEYSSPITEKYARLVNLAIGPGFSSAAPVVAANSGAALLFPDRTDGIEPRVGISWRPASGSSLVVRSGYGLYQNTSVYQTIAMQMAQQFPLSTSLSLQNNAANPLTLADSFHPANLLSRNTFGIDPRFRPGFAHNWELSVQRDLPGSLVLIATYLGIKGTRATQEFLPNTYPAGAPNPCPACPAGFAYMTSNGNSTRESGQLQLRRRLRSGFTASLQYTWSKSIDDAALGGRGQGVPVIAQNWLDLRVERGLSSFDQRHLLNLQAQYSTGMGVRGGALMTGWRSRLLKEWTFVTQVTAGSGLPETPVYLAAVPGTGVTGSIRPDYTGAPLSAAPAGLSLNPARLQSARLRIVGQRRTKHDHRPRAIFPECFHGQNLPHHGSVERRFPLRFHQCPESRQLCAMDHNGDEHAVWSARQSQPDAVYAGHLEVTVSRRTVVLLCIAALACPAQDVKFTSNSQLVIEIVLVKDKDGQPIEGLTSKNFTLTEDGKPQEIRICEFQRLREGPPKPYAAAAAGNPDPTPDVTKISPERPGDIRYRDRRLLALYFDMTAMPPPDQLRALSAAKQFVRQQISGPDLLAILKFSGGAVSVLQDFTDDRTKLDTILEKLVIREGQGNDDDPNDDSKADNGAAFGQDDGEFNIFNTDRQLAALQTAVQMLGSLNEKKSLVYFASGLRLSGVDNQAQLQATVNAAIRANVSFFPIDARGLVAQAPLGDATQGSPGGSGMYSGEVNSRGPANAVRSGP